MQKYENYFMAGKLNNENLNVNYGRVVIMVMQAG
jgi:hypothetical protein